MRRRLSALWINGSQVSEGSSLCISRGSPSRQAEPSLTVDVRHAMARHAGQRLEPSLTLKDQ